MKVITEERLITQEELKELLNYDPKTGLFTRLKKMGRCVPGSGVGCVTRAPEKHTREYISISINNNRYRAHRLAWMYMTGCWPKNEIDHINGNGIDNRWENLRDVDHSINMKNLKISSKNKSGLGGVHWCGSKRRWASEITVNRKYIFLGRFDSIFEAAAARKNANIKYGFHSNHGV